MIPFDLYRSPRVSPSSHGRTCNWCTPPPPANFSQVQVNCRLFRTDTIGDFDIPLSIVVEQANEHRAPPSPAAHAARAALSSAEMQPPAAAASMVASTLRARTGALAARLLARVAAIHAMSHLSPQEAIIRPSRPAPARRRCAGGFTAPGRCPIMVRPGAAFGEPSLPLQAGSTAVLDDQVIQTASYLDKTAL